MTIKGQFISVCVTHEGEAIKARAVPGVPPVPTVIVQKCLYKTPGATLMLDDLTGIGNPITEVTRGDWSWMMVQRSGQTGANINGGSHGGALAETDGVYQSAIYRTDGGPPTVASDSTYLALQPTTILEQVPSFTYDCLPIIPPFSGPQLWGMFTLPTNINFGMSVEIYDVQVGGSFFIDALTYVSDTLFAYGGSAGLYTQDDGTLHYFPGGLAEVHPVPPLDIGDHYIMSFQTTLDLHTGIGQTCYFLQRHSDGMWLMPDATFEPWPYGCAVDTSMSSSTPETLKGVTASNVIVAIGDFAHPIYSYVAFAVANVNPAGIDVAIPNPVMRATNLKVYRL